MTGRRKKRLNLFGLILIAVLGYTGYVCFGHIMEMRAISREAEATRQRLQQLQDANKAMISEKQKLTTPAYVEKLAREELGLVKPGEVPYIPASKN